MVISGGIGSRWRRAAVRGRFWSCAATGSARRPGLRGRRCPVRRVRRSSGSSTTDGWYYHKRYLERGWLEAVKAWVLGSRAERAWRGGRLLEENGFGTPQMLVAGWHGARCFTVTRAVAEGLHLERYVRELKSAGRPPGAASPADPGGRTGPGRGADARAGDRTRRPALGEHPGGGATGMSHVCLSGQRADPAVRADAKTEDDEEPGAVELRAGRVGESDAADAVLAGVSGGEPVATRGVEAVDSSDGCSHGAAACPAGEEERSCTLTDQGGTRCDCIGPCGSDSRVASAAGGGGGSVPA